MECVYFQLYDNNPTKENLTWFRQSIKKYVGAKELISFCQSKNYLPINWVKL